jgi:hypothetical protein
MILLPTLGLGFSVASSWTTNLRIQKINFPTIESHLNINHRIDSNGKISSPSTILKAKMLK